MKRNDWIAVVAMIVTVTTGGAAYALNTESRLTESATNDDNQLRALQRIEKRLDDLTLYLMNRDKQA